MNTGDKAIARRRDARPARRPQNEGHGRRLTAAFDAMERFPALAEPRDRLLRLVRDEGAPGEDLLSAIESDPALSIAVLRLAARLPATGGSAAASVRAAVGALGPSHVEAIARRAHVFDFFERTPAWDSEPERFRLHASATQRAADRVAAEVGARDRDEVLTGALLHDVGKLVLMHAYPGYPADVHGDARTPREQLVRERHELGIDHAVVGGVLMRRWQLPARLASIVERHHADDAQGGAAIVKLADLLAHHVQGRAVEPGRLLSAARAVGLPEAALRQMMYELPNVPTARRVAGPSPLSERETAALRGLAAGKVYKEIAADLGLSPSTIRSHLHNAYGKLGAVDRAQAVLIATARGWL